MLSARTLTEDRIRGFDAGTDVYLHKPFDLDELLSVVRNLLARRRRDAVGARQTAGNGGNEVKANGGEEFQFGSGRVVVNFDTYQVKVAGSSVRLTSLEMKLLRYFIEHEGSVVTRAQLLENVWGMSHSPTTRTVDNFIVNLRKYFEIDPAMPRHFISVRGAGYRFVSEEDEGGEK
jgi:two-component system OmpR family response regulator